MALNPLTGSRIREARARAGLRQADLARSAGVSASYLNLIEHGRRRLTPDILDRMALALDMSASALKGEGEGEIESELREAAAALAMPVEVEKAGDFANRYPGWAGLVAAQNRRLSQLERTIEALNDRMSQDPHLSAGVHELLSAAASVRSTAAILTETPDLEPEWRLRFEANLAQDSTRLALGAEALAGYLDGVASEATGIASPQEELEAWLAAQDWHVAGIEQGQSPNQILAQAPELASEAARRLALNWLTLRAEDAKALPLGPFLARLRRHGAEPGLLAQAFATDPARIFRRLAHLPADAGAIGLVICDASGTLVFRKPLPGFALPRFGAACPLWPLFQALTRAHQPIKARLSIAGRNSDWFDTRAWCDSQWPNGFDAPAVLRAYMLIQPASPSIDTLPDRAVGTSCRICPQKDCAARREPSIMGDAA